ncbi:hypothetical protein H480_01422 [Amycolatopsis vancoresmycina DSM 44592]|uniref:Uncharacterized protein n=1 Tax=Amycolatopsis vancoresmycina DSM 44592 TaxID=1292037 RepID=R1IIT8_9PSEU|nr:hypothetical protein H480_01422 [Amycolatopsis vancoresmycina DSM 44592]
MFRLIELLCALEYEGQPEGTFCHQQGVTCAPCVRNRTVGSNPSCVELLELRERSGACVVAAGKQSKNLGRFVTASSGFEARKECFQELYQLFVARLVREVPDTVCVGAECFQVRLGWASEHGAKSEVRAQQQAQWGCVRRSDLCSRRGRAWRQFGEGHFQHGRDTFQDVQALRRPDSAFDL